MHAPATRTLQVQDVIGGNEKNPRQVTLPADPRAPVPLPNPAVAQIKPGAPRTEAVSVTLEPDSRPRSRRFSMPRR